MLLQGAEQERSVKNRVRMQAEENKQLVNDLKEAKTE